MSGKGKYLPKSQLYDTQYSTVQYYNKSLEDLYESLKEKKLADKRKQKELEKENRLELYSSRGRCQRFYLSLWQNTFGHFGEDWIFLAFLGISVAIISYSIDQGVIACSKAKALLYANAVNIGFVKWLAWVCLPVILILWDVGFIAIIAPKAVGSGVPQIKTCLRGVYLKEFLSFKVLIAKWTGIIATIGSGLPMGKEGPLIQMASIIVTKISKYLSNFKSVYLNENKKIELIGAAYAAGVACTFNAPIGGVLFSVEISTAYYAVRNYWRGFFAAVWGATFYRLLYVWIDGLDTIRVVFPTSFPTDFPYDPTELLAFAILGIICGLGGSFYIFCQRAINRFTKTNKYILWVKNKNRFVYPFIIILAVSSMTYPPGLGQFIASTLAPKLQVVQLFSNFAWTQGNHTVAQQQIISNWSTDKTDIYANLVVFFWYQFIASILGTTLPIPNGAFIPNFRSGAALGRIIGELMATWFPQGIQTTGKISKIMPGAYATVGAAAYSGAVTHTLSTSVILFEMTSQIRYVIPVLISNLIANGIARLFTPSIYDVGIGMGKLPYLPDLLPSSSAIYRIFVEDFMIRDVKFVHLGMTYTKLKDVLKANKNIKVFPLVDNVHNMILLGSVSRSDLINLIEQQIGPKKRLELVESRPDDKKISSIEDVRQKIFDKYNVSKQFGSQTKMTDGQVLVQRVCDLPRFLQKEWEENQLNESIDFTLCHVDPAPFQLVEHTSLLKVHSLFSMMSINTAYVTNIGKLVGVVGLKDLRKAIEDANAGILPMERFGRTQDDKDGESMPLVQKKI
ncbi:chloride channel protein 2-like [Sitophilus oryzae]|uniref:Chloride channel protein n=1 Tax=Sitophilus oryzae TaxID=7048 RepID=A0A6J2XV05_SITOR|nr:chloride channel protein 2-like [Sitophilus oryzae]